MDGRGEEGKRGRERKGEGEEGWMGGWREGKFKYKCKREGREG